jgi:cold shock protein
MTMAVRRSGERNGGNLAERTTGVVTRLVSDKGFGFIRDGRGLEYFFHRSSCEDWADLTQGTAVSFVRAESQKGPRAEQVELQ